MASIECGKDARKQFAFHPQYRNLNHGSFGTYPTEIRKVLRRYQDLCEERPDQYILYDSRKILDRSREAIAKYLNAPVEACVFVPNATTAVNVVLRNLVFKPGDVIIFFSTIYGACEKTIAYITETTPAESRKVAYTYPVSDDFLCDAFVKTVEAVRAEGKNPRIAIFDTIVSMPGARMPFERLTDLCHQHKILSLIDGAHGVGHLPLDLGKLDPDFFTSNCHKWLYVPRGCAVFYVPVRNQKLMRSSLPTSHGFIPLPVEGAPPINNPIPDTGKSNFITQFEFNGTIDFNPYLCVPAALEWRSRIAFGDLKGEEAISTYLQQLSRRGGAIVSKLLGSAQILENEEGTLGRCGMVTLKLPLSYERVAGGDYATGFKAWSWMKEIMVRDYKTFMPIVFYDNAWWVRLSAQIYLEEEDFVWAGQTLKTLCARVERGDWRQDRTVVKGTDVNGTLDGTLNGTHLNGNDVNAAGMNGTFN